MKQELSNFIPQNRFKALIENGKFSFSSSEIVSDAYNLFSQNALLYIGYGFSAAFLYILASLVLSFIPFVGSFGQSFISGTLMAGFFVGAFRQKYFGRLVFEDFFSVINKFLPLGMSSLLISLFASLAFIPAVIFGVIFIFTSGADIAAVGNFDGFLQLFSNAAFMLPMLASILVGIAASAYLLIIFSLAAPMIALGEIEFWDAMMLSKKIVEKNFGAFLIFNIFLGVVNLAGALLLGFGLLVTVPLTMISVFVLYDKMVMLNEAAA
jgi:hypothetical protein